MLKQCVFSLLLKAAVSRITRRSAGKEFQAAVLRRVIFTNGNENYFSLTAIETIAGCNWAFHARHLKLNLLSIYTVSRKNITLFIFVITRSNVDLFTQYLLILQLRKFATRRRIFIISSLCMNIIEYKNKKYPILCPQKRPLFYFSNNCQKINRC